jgi:hypothetical protein
MRLTLAAALSACLALLGCAHPAYGPSSDARLETATGEGASGEGGADAASLKCTDLKAKFDDARNTEKPESERMQGMNEVFTAAKERHTRLEEAVSKNPDLLYSSNADQIKQNRDECNSFFADVRSDFDRFIRDVTDLPVIKDVQAKEDVARIDLTVLRNAITSLDSDDKDVLLGKVDAAEKKVGRSSPPVKTGKKR